MINLTIFKDKLYFDRIGNCYKKQYIDGDYSNYILTYSLDDVKLDSYGYLTGLLIVLIIYLFFVYDLHFFL